MGWCVGEWESVCMGLLVCGGLAGGSVGVCVGVWVAGGLVCGGLAGGSVGVCVWVYGWRVGEWMGGWMFGRVGGWVAIFGTCQLFKIRCPKVVQGKLCNFVFKFRKLFKTRFPSTSNNFSKLNCRKEKGF